MTIHQQEQEHLTLTYNKLKQAQQEINASLNEENEAARDEMKHSGDDIRLNYDNWGDRLETLAAIEMKNRELDQRRFSIDVMRKNQEKVNRLLESPYFGKIDVTFSDEEDQESFYLGINGFADEFHNNLIYDWRSPIAELFYNNELGKSFYEANKQMIEVDINNRRQLVTEKDELKLVFDTAVAIDDEVLLSVLEKEATETMQDITSSIQKEQNDIIRDETHSAILVNGVAGSGKTSVVMQRIAYLLYRNRQVVNSDNVLILSPNEEFIQYISDVLPSLGEKNPLNMTFRKLINKLYPFKVESEAALFERISQVRTTKQNEILRSREFTEFIKEKGSQILLGEKIPFNPLTNHNDVAISKAEIIKLFEETPTNLPLVERIQGTKVKLESYWDEYLRKESLKPSVQEEMQHLSEEDQLAYIGKMIPDDPNKLAFYTKKILEKKSTTVTKGIRQLRWLDISHLMTVLYKSFTGQDLVRETSSLDYVVTYLLIKHLYVEKLPVFKVEFLLVDEIQDYTPAQLILLSELFTRGKITVVGDENQAIFNSHISFTEMEEILKGYHNKIETYHLQKSYRSSGAITETFNELIASNRQVEPVQAKGEPVVKTKIKSNQDFKVLVENKLAEKEVSAVTIITKTSHERSEVLALFDENLIRQKKIVVLSIMLAKGLEFDHVILYDVSDKNYVSEQDKRLLYTAVSRGMKSLTITYKNQLTLFLSKKE